MQLYNCTVVQPYSFTVVQVYICIVVQLYSFTAAQLYSCTGVLLYSCTFVQLYSCKAVQLYSCTVVQLYSCTAVQLYSCVHSCINIPISQQWPLPPLKGLQMKPLQHYYQLLCSQHYTRGVLLSYKLRHTRNIEQAFILSLFKNLPSQNMEGLEGLGTSSYILHFSGKLPCPKM